jgi:hypothetical protein
MNGVEKGISTAKPRRGTKARMTARTRAAAAALIALASAAISLIPATAASAALAPVFYPPDPGATCYVNESAVNFVVNTPIIYAIDYHPGPGNDAQWVAFRSRVVDYWSGLTVSKSNWSNWAVAYDNSPAVYSGHQSVQVQKTSASSRYLLEIDIEWWQTPVPATGVIRLNRYWAYVNLGGSPQGTVQTSC